MNCEHRYSDLIHKYLDGDASGEEKRELEMHLATCSSCKQHVQELKKAIAFIQSSSHIEAPENFTNSVMSKLPKKKATSKGKKWLKKHPIAVAAAIFIMLMSASVSSLWMGHDEQVTVTGSGNVQIDRESGRVVVPKGEVIEGDLIVRNGELLVEGEVRGNVLLVNSEPYYASAGHVSGEVAEVNQALEWIWYHIKHFFTKAVPFFDKE
ncbi:anti-sigma factor family protein [Halalkalibacter urbisdiaboli]|uniref:anti-sigma factor family protein n=1 Tax=Halalkalibacter urbisdiaboli TaxID=1960589 RepID=UPI000B445805|nr:anti-sigma factor [Halalkalibacter urbisdiaboli]